MDCGITQIGETRYYSAARRPRRPPRRVLRKVSVAMRSGKATTREWRSVAERPSQLAISLRVRPQPMQNPVSGSSTQIFTQGVSMSGADIRSMAVMWGVTGEAQWHAATHHVKPASILEYQLAVFDAEAAQA